jgi:hypothetical protein
MVWDLWWQDAYGNSLAVAPEATNLELCFTPQGGWWGGGTDWLPEVGWGGVGLDGPGCTADPVSHTSWYPRHPHQGLALTLRY